MAAELDAFAIGSRIAAGSRRHLDAELACHGHGETLADSADLKSTHRIDTEAAEIGD